MRQGIKQIQNHWSYTDRKNNLMKKTIFTIIIISFAASAGFAQMTLSNKYLPAVFKLLQKPSFRQVMSKVQSAANANLAENKLSVKEPYLIYTNLWDSANKVWYADTLEKYVITWNKNKSLQNISDVSWDSVSNGAVSNTIMSGFVKINSVINIDNNLTMNYFPTDIVIQILQNGKWVNYEKEIVTFDQNNRLSAVLVQQWASNAWVDYEKDNLSYDSRGNFIELNANLITGNMSTLTQGIKESFTFNGNGNITSLVQSNSNGGAYINSLWETFTLDGNGAITAALLYSFDSLTSQWGKTDSFSTISWLSFDPLLRIDYQTLNTDGIFGVGGNKYLGYTDYKYNVASHAWINPQKSTYSYNADSLTTDILVKIKQNNNWVNNTSDSTSYYPRDDIKTYLPRFWGGSKWLNTSLGSNNINKYDGDGDLTECIAQNTDQNNPNTFDNYSKTEYLYNSNTGIEQAYNTTFKVYPNPVSNMLNIDWGKSVSQGILTITDLTGKTVQTKYVSGRNMNSLDVTGLVPGMYFLSVNSGSEVSSGKFIKE